MLHRVPLLLCFLLPVYGIGWSQAIQIFTEPLTGCTGDTVSVHLHTHHFFDVGSMTLFLEYDPQELSYDTTIALHPLLPGMLVNQFASPSTTVGISWFTTTMMSVDIDTGIIATIRFVLLADSALPVFHANSEVTDPLGSPLSTQFATEHITPYYIPITLHPTDAFVKPGVDATFSVTTPIADVSFQWQSSSNLTDWTNLHNNDTFAGVNQGLLTINNTPVQLFDLAFRCLLVKGNCSTYTHYGVLIQDTLSFVMNHKSLENKEQPHPNPYSHTFQLPIIHGLAKYHTFALYSINGRMVYQQNITNTTQGSRKVTIAPPNTPPGQYIGVLLYTDKQGTYQTKSYRIIKQ